jgi:predicted CopG family antitoxin
VKAVLIHLEDDEYKKLVKTKGKKTWKELLLKGGEAVIL